MEWQAVPEKIVKKQLKGEIHDLDRVGLGRQKPPLKNQKKQSCGLCGALRGGGWCSVG
jgi:hypothetical protein